MKTSNNGNIHTDLKISDCIIVSVTARTNSDGIDCICLPYADIIGGTWYIHIRKDLASFDLLPPLTEVIATIYYYVLKW